MSDQIPRAGLDEARALALLERARANEEAHQELLALARTVRDREHPREVAFCGILQAKLGGCREDCAFCCQSSRHQSVGRFSRPLASESELMARARAVAEMGARAFSVVTAGRRLSRPEELARICRVVSRVRSELGLETCASLGRLSPDALRRLREAGLQRYHHNIEAAPSFFDQVITTYLLDESLETLAAAREAGLTLCSAGVFGMGETDAQRVELLALLRRHEVEGTPLNFLEPHPGTPLGDRPLLEPDEAQRIIAIHRLMLPATDVIVAGARLLVLGEQPGAALDAGANAVMVGDAPTSFGDEVARDRAMVRERGLRLRPPALR